MKATPASAGRDPESASSTGGWPALVLTLIVAAAAIYAFSPRPAPPFAPTEVHPDGVLIDGLARDGDRLLAVGEQGNILYADSVKGPWHERSEEHTSELQSLMRISYAVFCLKKKKQK